MAIRFKERKHQSYGEKFGVKSLREGYTQMPNLLITNMVDLKLGHSEILVLLVLLKHWHKKDAFPFLSVQTIGNYIGRSRRHTQRLLTELETKPIHIAGWDGEPGYIRRITRRISKHGDVHQESNRYDLRPTVDVVNFLADKASEEEKKRRFEETLERARNYSPDVSHAERLKMILNDSNSQM